MTSVRTAALAVAPICLFLLAGCNDTESTTAPSSTSAVTSTITSSTAAPTTSAGPVVTPEQAPAVVTTVPDETYIEPTQEPAQLEPAPAAPAAPELVDPGFDPRAGY